MKLKKEFHKKLKQPKYAGLFISKNGLPLYTSIRWIRTNFWKLKLHEELLKQIFETEEQLFETETK